MSSPEEDYDGDVATQNTKKRRIQRACDMCRRKKIRCDGAQMPKYQCSNCVSYSLDCTYVEAAKKRGPPKGYVESLESRLEKMEKLLNKLCPNADFSKELGGTFDKDAWSTDRNGEPSSATTTKPVYAVPTVPSQTSVITSPPSLPTPVSQLETDDLDPSDDEIVAQRNIVQSLRKMSMNPASMRYHGKSSSLLFIQTAMDLKQEYAGVELPKTIDPDAHCTLLKRRQQQYWSLHPWLTSNVQEEHSPHKDWPPPDLLQKLVDLYFTNMNDFMPLLHRPTFEQGIKESLHLRDEGFGSTLLLVCANGARFTDDLRVLLEDNQIPQSAGWKWFQQVQMVRKSLLAPPRLYDLQIYALTAGFLQGTSAPQACWTIIGVGIRMAQDVGAHRKKVYSSSPTIEEELWRRAFWVLVAMDRSTSFALGRPCAIQDEDFDIDLPTECDDEHWIASERAFKQPPGKPSRIAFFNCFVRLHQILAFAMRTIYSINKSKALLGFVGQQWEQHIVAELDSALNKWIDSVPDHLRWDPTRENLLFLNQSANLYANYYQLQIAVHRPFIPSPRKPSPLSFPSLAICTNAARSCIHVLDVQYKRAGMPTYFNQMSLFTAGIVLLLNIWGGKRSGLSTDPAKEMADVHKCMKMLRLLEPHWHTAGRLWDILYELASVGDLPLPQASPAPTQKRERDSDSSVSAISDPSPPCHSTDSLPRVIAGNKRVPKEGQSLAAATFAQPLRPQSSSALGAVSDSEMYATSSSSASSPSSSSIMPAVANAAQNSLFALPVHTDELGRLPLHPGFNVSYDTPMPRDWTPQPPPQQQQHVGPSMQQQQPPVNMNGGQYDPRFMVMYNMQGPGFGELFAAPSAFSTTSLPPTMPPPSAGQGQGLSSEEIAFTDNTLAMWSTAPTSFEWDDWGTYINNVSWMHSPMGNAHGQGGT